MKIRAAWFVLIPALLSSFSTAAALPQAGKSVSSDVALADVAKIKVGNFTGAQVRELLGNPWRSVNYGDCNVVDYQETWEYLGHDANGAFKVHIVFDEARVARIVAMDNRKGPIVVLAAAPKPETRHHHESAGG